MSSCFLSWSRLSLRTYVSIKASGDYSAFNWLYSYHYFWNDYNVFDRLFLIKKLRIKSSTTYSLSTCLATNCYGFSIFLVCSILEYCPPINVVFLFNVELTKSYNWFMSLILSLIRSRSYKSSNGSVMSESLLNSTCSTT